MVAKLVRFSFNGSGDKFWVNVAWLLRFEMDRFLTSPDKGLFWRLQVENRTFNNNGKTISLRGRSQSHVARLRISSRFGSLLSVFAAVFGAESGRTVDSPDLGLTRHHE